jgi:hypothetical protein
MLSWQARVLDTYLRLQRLVSPPKGKLDVQKERSEVDVTLEVGEHMQHVWHFAAGLVPESRQAIARMGEFVQRSMPTGA